MKWCHIARDMNSLKVVFMRLLCLSTKMTSDICRCKKLLLIHVCKKRPGGKSASIVILTICCWRCFRHCLWICVLPATWQRGSKFISILATPSKSTPQKKGFITGEFTSVFPSWPRPVICQRKFAGETFPMNNGCFLRFGTNPPHKNCTLRISEPQSNQLDVDLSFNLSNETKIQKSQAPRIQDFTTNCYRVYSITVWESHH